jgi:hypothetical protein
MAGRNPETTTMGVAIRRLLSDQEVAEALFQRVFRPEQQKALSRYGPERVDLLHNCGLYDTNSHGTVLAEEVNKRLLILSGVSPRSWSSKSEAMHALAEFIDAADQLFAQLYPEEETPTVERRLNRGRRLADWEDFKRRFPKSFDQWLREDYPEWFVTA